MTRNVYFGLDVGPLLSASNLPDLIAAVAAGWAQVQGTNIPERAAKIAQEIATAKPDLVALQEVAQWFTNVGGKIVIQYDWLELILRALSSLGLFYVPIAIKTDLDQAAPIDSEGGFIRLVDRHAILLRVTGSASQIQPHSTRAETFSALLRVSDALAGSLAVPRSWIALDGTVDGRSFRLVETHLESLSVNVQIAQARELLAQTASVESPVVVVGDFNSDAGPDGSDDTLGYQAFMSAGFEDVWTSLEASLPGSTCCQQPDLLNLPSELKRRIDLILIRGEVEPIEVRLVGMQPTDRTPSGLWPSDHAGVVAALRIF